MTVRLVSSSNAVALQPRCGVQWRATGSNRRGPRPIRHATRHVPGGCRFPHRPIGRLPTTGRGTGTAGVSATTVLRGCRGQQQHYRRGSRRPVCPTRSSRVLQTASQRAGRIHGVVRAAVRNVPPRRRSSVVPPLCHRVPGGGARRKCPARRRRGRGDGRPCPVGSRRYGHLDACRPGKPTAGWNGTCVTG